MGPMEIYIFGDLDFAYFILNGITMLYANDATFIKAGFVLSMLFLLWSFIKWSMNPEKNTYPVREWAFGLIFFLIFGGTDISPKVDVQLHSANTPGLFKSTITDVPVIAAVPSWLATNIFYSITKVIQESGTLIMPGYERFRGSGIIEKPDADPLNALVRLNTISASNTLPSNTERAIKDYLTQCYFPYVAFNPDAEQLKFEKKQITENIWSQLAISNQHMEVSTVTPQEGKAIVQKCEANHAALSSLITDSATGFITEQVVDTISTRDIHPDEIKFAVQIINEQLTGTADSPNPYTIMTNMFLARSIKDTINNSPESQSMQTWASKMVFEGERKRTFESAGDRSMFMKIYIPTITAIETFSFYIAPILMIFSILGGFGFSFIGKYLMLVVFINLWSFIKVFVDIFTALALSRAFPTGGDPIDYLGFGNYTQTMSEIESMLTMASNLTMAIPFFSMFLLYGGVHSVMGVMRTVTGGSVDGANMAPSMATTMNAGVMQQGDTGASLTVSTGQFAKTHNSGSNAMYGQQTAGSDISGGYQNAAGTLKAHQESANQNWNKALSSALSSTKLSSDSNSQTDGENATSSAGFQQLISTTDASVRAASQNGTKDFQVAAQLIAGAAINAAVGTNSGESTKVNPKDASADIDPKDPKSLMKSRLMSLGLDGSLAAQFANNMSTKDAQSLNDLYSTTKTNAETASSQQGFDKSHAFAKMKQYADSVTNDKSLTEMSGIGQQIADLKTTEAKLTESSGGAQALSASNTLDYHRAQPSYDMNAFTKFYNSLGKQEQERIGTLLDQKEPPMNAGDVAQKVNAITQLGADAFNGAMISSTVLKQLHKQDGNLDTTSGDFAIASKFYKELANHAGPVYGQAFQQAAQLTSDISQTTSTVKNTSNGITDPDVKKAEGAKTTVNTATSEKASDNTDPRNAQTHAAAGLQQNGVPTKQTPATGAFETPTLTDAKQIEQNINAEESKLKAARTMMTPLSALQDGFFNTIGDISSLFTGGRDDRWGATIQDTNRNLSAYSAKQLGVQSGQMEAGLTELTKASNSHSMNRLFTDLNSEDPRIKAEAAQKISAMNDAATLLSTKEGASAIFKAYSPEDGERLVQNAQQFKQFMAARTPEDTRFNEDFFNAISRSRMSGAITDDGASVAIQSVAYMGSGEAIPGSAPRAGNINSMSMPDQDANYTKITNSAKALSWGLNADESTFKNTEDAKTIQKSLAPPTNGSQNKNSSKEKSYIDTVAPASDADQYRPAALQQFIDDTHNQSLVAGIMLDDNKFIPGYNGTDKQSNINQAPVDYVRQLTRNNDPVSDFNNSLIMKSNGVEQSTLEGIFGLSERKLMDRQESIFVNSTTPSEYASRLGSAGFSDESLRIQEGVNDLTQQAQQAGIAIDKQELKEDFVKATKEVDSLPSIKELTNRN